MKRKTAAVLAICIAFTLLSCKCGDTPVEPTPPEATPTHVPTATPMVAPDDEDPYIIAILTDMPKDEPETTAILRAKELYQDRIAWYLAARDQDDALKRMYYDWDIFVGNALQLISDPRIKVLIFLTVGYMEDPYDFVEHIRKTRPDMLCIVVDCYKFDLFTGTEEVFMYSADIVLSIDKKATAVKAVNQAKRMGAIAVVDFTVLDRRYHKVGDVVAYLEDEKIVRLFPEISSVIRAECENLSLLYVESLDKYSRAMWPWDGAYDEYGEYGSDICFLSNNCKNQLMLDNMAFSYGIIVQLCHPGIYHRRNYLRGWPFYTITANEDHFGDLEWAISETEAIVEKESFSGRFSTWRVPFFMAAATAAVEYAIGYCEGEIEGKADLAAMKGCFEKAMEMYNAGDIGFELSVDPEYRNHFMFTQDYIVLVTSNNQ